MIIKKIKNITCKVKTCIFALLTAVIVNVNAYATGGGEEQFNNVLNWILIWVRNIGIVLALWGAVQIGMSFSTEDAGQRRKGILELISGLMVMAIGIGGPSIIGY